MTGRSIIAIALAGAMGCSSSPSAPDNGDEALAVDRLRGEPVSFVYSSGLTQSQQMIIRDVEQWRQTWEAIWRHSSPRPALPDIDFSRDMLIVAALGERPTGGYSIFIDAASAGADRLAIRLRSVSPGNGCAVTLAQTQPVDIARVPRRNGPAAFSEQRDVQRCG